jgi:PAS domain S-box-containing protein
MNGLAQELDELGGDITDALEELPVPAVLLDASGMVRWQNKAAKALRGDMAGTSFEDFVQPDDLSHAQAAFTHILCRGEPAEFSLRLKGPSGEPIPAEISSVPVKSDGSVVGVFGLARPVETPRKTAKVSGRAASLTPRQLEVLQLLAQGASTHEIASQLHLSTTTVRNHVANVLAVLGAHTRLQAVIAAQSEGLLDS